VFGLAGTTAIALSAPVLAAALLLTRMPRPLSAWAILAVGPLVLPFGAGWRFRRGSAPRWSAVAPALYLLLTFAGYFLLGVRP
jgi:hypothetical protein